MPLTAMSDKHMIIEGATIVWEGVTQPETLDAKGGQAGGFKWNLKLVVPPTSPDLPILDQLSQSELSDGEFKGVLPNGGLMPLGVARPDEFNGQFPGWGVFRVTTYRQPDVRDENGR